MKEMRKISASSCTCKVCAGEAILYDVVDFNKNCEERRGHFLELSGVPIYYYRCNACGTIFTTAFDNWSNRDFEAYIYNDDYIKVDLDSESERPQQNARLVRALITSARGISMLDYGSGAGLLARLLTKHGFDVRSWDPFFSRDTPPSDKFDLITSFEVLEHTNNPDHTLSEIDSRLKNDGALLFSTYLIDPDDDNRRHWYISPRNGHLTVYTLAGLKSLFTRFDLQLHHYSRGLHLAFRTVPDWLTRDSVHWDAIPGEALNAPQR